MEPNFSDETPTKQLLIAKLDSTPKTFVDRFLSNNQTFSPSPTSLTHRVRNPFENHLHDQLHLPVISSPSLFHLLSTPKRSSGIEQTLEWTIDELSSLKPVNFTPHETQFREDLDPIREAQAQAAINSFFTEQKVVPSPQDCSLRNHKIILKETTTLAMKIVNSTVLHPCQSSSSADTSQPKRDIATQTAFTFPPILPKEIEDLFMKYRHDDENACDSESMVTLDTTEQNNRSMMDISVLRRKLFINQPESPYCDDAFGDHLGLELSPPPRTPELTGSCNKQVNHSANLKSNDSFGDLSPISRDCSSPSLDISMMSDCGQEKTPSRKEELKKLKKKGKNLSESFCFLQNEFQDDLASDKENNFKNLLSEPKRFGRFDSGFSADEDSKLSAEFMQF